MCFFFLYMVGMTKDECEKIMWILRIRTTRKVVYTYTVQNVLKRWFKLRTLAFSKWPLHTRHIRSANVTIAIKLGRSLNLWTISDKLNWEEEVADLNRTPAPSAANFNNPTRHNFYNTRPKINHNKNSAFQHEIVPAIKNKPQIVLQLDLAQISIAINK